jgi:hypothetical protein
MTNEKLRLFLDRRERELRNQLAALNGEILEITVELNEIVRAKGALNIESTAETEKVLTALEPTNSFAGLGLLGIAQAGTFVGRRFTTDVMPQSLRERYDTMTIKELVLQSLQSFVVQAEGGATAARLRDYIRDVYGRTVEPSSLRPQLSRLKAEGLIRQDPSTDIWKLVLRGVTADELIAMGHWPPGAEHKPPEEPAGQTRGRILYDHPSSKKMRKNEAE